MRVTNRSTRGVSNAVGRDPRPTISDLLLPISVVLWIVGVHRIHPSPVPLAILPAGSVVVFLAGLGVLIVSTGLLLTRHKFSSHRMALHLGTLIVMLYGTAPIVYPEPRFAWLYKHIAITNYIAVHHVLSRSMDIYRIWPGFFALTAWIDKVAGVSTPLVYASWAELFFEILYVLELAWIFRALQLDERERWLALFLFAGANWIAQDYFSPQGFGLVLSLGVFGMALHWLKSEQRPWVTKFERWVGRLLGRRRSRRFGKWMLPTRRRRQQHPRATTDHGGTAVAHPVEPSRWFAIVAAPAHLWGADVRSRALPLHRRGPVRRARRRRAYTAMVARRCDARDRSRVPSAKLRLREPYLRPYRIHRGLLRQCARPLVDLHEPRIGSAG